MFLSDANGKQDRLVWDKDWTEWQLKDWQTKLKHSLPVTFLVNFGEECSRFKSRWASRTSRQFRNEHIYPSKNRNWQEIINFQTSNYGLLFCQFLQIFFRSQILCYWKGHSSSKITSLRRSALLYKTCRCRHPSARISNLHSIFLPRWVTWAILCLARIQNSGNADLYLDFCSYPLHSTYAPYAPKGQQSHMEFSKQCCPTVSPSLINLGTTMPQLKAHKHGKARLL